MAFADYEDMFSEVGVAYLASYELSNSYQAPTGAQLVGGQEHDKSCEEAFIDSKMAGPIAMKLSDIDQGNSPHVLGPKN